jgi:hypothetical protein
MEKNQMGSTVGQIVSQKKSVSMMNELLDRLSFIIGDSEKNVYGYREVLRGLDSLTLPMDEPTPCGDSEMAEATVINRLSNLIALLGTATKKQSEMLEEFKKII